MLVKGYCGLLMLNWNGTYVCVNKYTYEILCSGTKEECEIYFRQYINKLAERDVQKRGDFMATVDMELWNSEMQYESTFDQAEYERLKAKGYAEDEIAEIMEGQL